MKQWIGRWLIGVSVLHTIFAMVVFREVLVSIINQGVFNTVGNDPRNAAVVWFVLFGVALFICGLLINAVEKFAPDALPRSVGWSLLILTASGVALMPASGFWLVLPPAIFILVRKRATLAVANES